MTVIKDGGGTGKLVKVNDYNQLDVNSVSLAEPIYIAREFGDYYTANFPATTSNSINEHIVLWLRNDNASKKIFIYNYIFGYNGGNTNHNRCMRFKVYRNPGVPTANYTSVTINSVNYTSTSISNVTAYKWNGIGDGMTLTGSPVSASDIIVGIGLTMYTTEGVPILGYGNSIAISLIPEEIGDFNTFVRFYME